MMSATDCTAAILAGGRSRRMGANKAMIELDGIPLIDRVLNALRQVFDKILIVGGELEWSEAQGMRYIADIRPGSGPLAGLEAALLNATTPMVFLVGCDMPFLNPSAIHHVISRLEHEDAVVPMIANWLQPLHAVYHVRSLPVIQRRLDAGQFSMHGLLNEIAVQIISEEEMRAVDPLLKSHLGLNSPEDLAAARDTCEEMKR